MQNQEYGQSFQKERFQFEKIKFYLEIIWKYMSLFAVFCLVYLGYRWLHLQERQLQLQEYTFQKTEANTKAETSDKTANLTISQKREEPTTPTTIPPSLVEIEIERLIMNTIDNNGNSNDYEEAKKALTLDRRYIEDLVSCIRDKYLQKFAYNIIDKNGTVKKQIEVDINRTKLEPKQNSLSHRYTLSEIQDLGLKAQIEIVQSLEDCREYLLGTQRWRSITKGRCMTLISQ